MFGTVLTSNIVHIACLHLCQNQRCESGKVSQSAGLLVASATSYSVQSCFNDDYNAVGAAY